MTKSRRDRFSLLAMLGLCTPLFARFEGEDGGESGGGGGSDEGGSPESTTSEATEAPATNESTNETVPPDAGASSSDNSEEQESTPAGEQGADTGGQPATPTLQDILTRLGAATASAPAKAAPGAPAATTAPKGQATDAAATEAAAELLGMTAEELADIEAQMPVAGKKLTASLQTFAAKLEALSADHAQRQEQAQHQAIIAKHDAIDQWAKTIPGAAEQYGTRGTITEATLAERNATYDLADKVFCSMRDSGKPITETEAFTWAHTLRQQGANGMTKPAAIRVVAAEAKARNRQMTVPSGTGRGPAKTDARKDAANFFDQGLKQLTGQG